MAPPIGLFAAASYLYVAYQQPGRVDFWTYVAAAAGSAGIGPFTVLFMGKTNAALIQFAEAVEMGREKDVSGKEREVRELLRRWGGLNFVRAGLLVGSAGLGAFAALV